MASGKKRGRPPVDSEAVNVRMHVRLIVAVDQWAAKNAPGITRPEAVRLILMKALRLPKEP